ncbi:MAG: hydrogenase formation protein HypD [bacterium]|nr:hydrogenase formation protein HypD [bacterium]
MKALSGFRDADLISAVLRRLQSLSVSRKLRFMEVCGGHTATIYRFAIHDLLPESIELCSGPGCPVCVTPCGFIDHAIALAEQHGVTLATFGDLIRVPGSYISLAEARARGIPVRVFYSAADALDFADAHRDTEIVFLGIGFETTACTLAATLADAVTRGVKNFKILSALKTMPEALRVLLSSAETQIDGLILPGHVTTVVGSDAFDFIGRELRVPCSVSGFEPLDILETVLSLASQCASGQAVIENRYARAVTRNGNEVAQDLMRRHFAQVDCEWRGLGVIPKSGLVLRNEYSEWDAGLLPIELPAAREHPACKCGDVLRGALHPRNCPLFGKACTPESPAGACMVSSEGACAAVFHFEPIHA